MITSDVFISHAHEDEATADAVYTTLEAAGVRCWMARRNISPGAEWPEAIVDAIDHCRAMVVIFSSSANKSRQIVREVQRACDKDVRVVPFRIENITPDGSLAYYLGPLRWLDASTPPLDGHLQELAVWVRALARITTSDGEERELKAKVKQSVQDEQAAVEAKNADSANVVLHRGRSSKNLVFASGFLVPHHFLGISYFRGLKDHIAAAGEHAALFPLVPPIGTCDARARVLADAIQQAYPDGAVHIIAHLMGGLDSRTLIAGNLNGLSNPGRIASLTTVSTPHRGSPVADLLAGPRPHDARRVVYDAISRAIGQLGVDTGAFANLTTEVASRVPDAAQSHPHIRYRSYFASGRPGPLPTCLVLAPLRHYIRTVVGQENDGFVALGSARYGEFQQPFWHCDHVDVIGHNLDTADLGGFQFDHFAAFDAIISSL
jgi:TIR domain